jgi:hypothetical protein
MRTLLKLSLSFAAVLLLAVPAATGTAPGGRVKQTHNPITTLAIDSARIAYASGGKVYVLNVRTGATTLMQGSYNRHTAEVAIAGKRVAWITRYAVGNSEQTSESLFTGSLTTRGRLLASGRRTAILSEGVPVAWQGRWIAGAVGAGYTLAVSTWWSSADGTCTAQRLNLISPDGLHQIATGPGAIVAASAIPGNAGFGYIAVLRSEEMWPDGAPTPAVTVGVYAFSGRLVREITPSSAQEIALTKNELVVLTKTKTLEVYDWRKSGTLLHTWPIAADTPNLRPGHLAAASGVAVYSVDPRRAGSRKLHVVGLATGKDIVLATGNGAGYYARDAAMSPYGLAYAINYRDHGKLVFVPMAKLVAKVS